MIQFENIPGLKKRKYLPMMLGQNT